MHPTSNIPDIVIGGFVLVGCLVLFSILKGIGEWTHNNAQPGQTRPARLVSKRTSGKRNRFCFVTFEFADGVRSEFEVGFEEFGLLAVGDQGDLEFQGTRYNGFKRNISPQPAELRRA